MANAAGKDYAAEAREIDRLVQQPKPDARKLLDVACGTVAISLLSVIDTRSSGST